jgi:rhodanese-related sulfurtransferase
MKKTHIIIAIVVVIVASYLIYTYVINKPKVEKKNIHVTEFEEKLNDPNAILLDVRSAFEFKGDKIKGAQNISVSSPDFNARIDNLDKNKTYLLYCQHGPRGKEAAKIMKDKGFQHVYNLSGGMEEWKYYNKPVVK